MHAAITEIDSQTWRVGFEDTLGGGDHDYNDITVLVKGGLYIIPPNPQKPDFLVLPGDITFSKNNPTEGDIVEIQAKVHNLGNSTDSNVSLGFYDGDPDNGGQLISTTTINGIGQEENVTKTIQWNTTGKAGTHNIYVKVDPENLIDEAREDNNKANKEIVVAPTPTQTPPTVYITANPPTHDINVSTNFTFTANPVGSWGNNISYSWSDTYEKCVTADFVLTGQTISRYLDVACGNATISVISEDEKGNKANDTYLVTVHENITPQPIPTPTFNISGFKINNATGSGVPNWNITLTNSTMQKSILTGADGSYIFMNLANGTYNVAEETKTGWTSVSPMSQQVTINGADMPNINFTNQPPSPTETPVLTTITVSPSTAMLNVTETQGFTATALDQNNIPMSGINISWTISNSTVGSVTPLFAVTDSNGNVPTTFTASAAGTTTVTAINGTVSGSADVTVAAVTPTPPIPEPVPPPPQPSQPVGHVMLKKEASPTVASGGIVDYTLILTNDLPFGADSLSNIQITDKPPSQYITYIMGEPTYSISPGGGNFVAADVADVDCSASNILAISCTVNKFAPGTTVTIRFSAQVIAEAVEDQVITNTASAKVTTQPEIKASAETIIFPNVPYPDQYKLAKKIADLLKKINEKSGPPARIPAPIILKGISCGLGLVTIDSGSIADQYQIVDLIKDTKKVGNVIAIVKDVRTGEYLKVPLDSVRFIKGEACVEMIVELLAPGQLEALEQCLAGSTPEERACQQNILEKIGLGSPAPVVIPEGVAQPFPAPTPPRPRTQ